MTRRDAPLLPLCAAMVVGGLAGRADAAEPADVASTEPAPILERETPDPDELGSTPILTGGIETGIFAERRADADVASLSPRLHLGIRPHEQVEVEAGFGMVATVSEGEAGRESSVRPSNLIVAGSRVQQWGGDKYREAKIGFLFSLPTSLARTPAEQAGYDYALGGRAGWNPWEWTPTTLGLVVPAELRAQVFRRMVLGGDVGIGGMFASVDNTAQPSIVAQGAALARFVTRWFGVGVRLSAVYNGQRDDDHSQAAVSPFADASLCRRGGRRVQGTFARATTECPVFATARFNVNLDAPYGYATSEAMRVWGLQLGLGWAVF